MTSSSVPGSGLPPVVSEDWWETAHEALLVKEEELPRTPPYRWWRLHDEHRCRGRR